MTIFVITIGRRTRAQNIAGVTMRRAMTLII